MFSIWLQEEKNLTIEIKEQIDRVLKTKQLDKIEECDLNIEKIIASNYIEDFEACIEISHGVKYNQLTGAGLLDGVIDGSGYQ